MLLMIDNYDSFTYNLVQYFAELGADVVVHRNDEITLEQIELLKPQYIVVSPGPCTPNEAGISVATIQRFYLWDGDLVVSEDLYIFPEFTKVLDQVVGE